ncbi:MAG: TolC family protein, partial [Candidatus Poribacteria bacterium]|nr:TolC family protein [Candidatus Poribacteria bacterium]
QSLSGDAKLDLASAELEVAESREGLNALMGLWGESVSWSVASRLPDAPENPMELEGLEKTAIENSIDLALARQNIIAMGKQLGIAKATKLVPSLDLGMEIERAAGEWASGPSIGFEIPLFNSNQAKVDSAKFELRRRQQEFHALAVEIRAAVRAARRRLTTARQAALFYQNEILPLRRKIVEQVQLQYNAMQVGTPRLLLAKQQEIGAGRAYVQSLYNYHVARVELDQILAGRLLESTSTTKFTSPFANAESLPDGSSEATLTNGHGGH